MDMSSYSWPEMVRYWKTHNAERGRFDIRQDPDGLNNVCDSGAPMAVNRYYNRGQRRAYLSLLSQVTAGPDDRALDVGCGAARWSRLLDGRGYSVTGIDLQDELIEANTRLYGSIRFHCCAIQDFHDRQPFQLISSVTVLQHLPYDQQVTAAKRISGLLDHEGHLLILENIADHAAHVFPHSIIGWTKLFEDEGMEAKAVEPYDYSPALRSYAMARRALKRSSATSAERLPGPERFGMVDRKVPSTARRTAYVGACAVDSVLDPLLSRMHAPLPTAHVGILFRKVR